MDTINPLATSLEEVRISELPEAAQANPTDLLEASQADSGQFVSRKLALDMVSTLIASSAQIQAAIDTAIGAIPPPDLSNYLPLTGGTLTGPLNGTVSNWSGKLTITAADAAQAALFRGVSKGVRFVPGVNDFAIEGVDNTGNTTFQPLRLAGSDLRFGVPGEAMRFDTTGLGIGIMPALSKLHVKGGGSVASNPSTSASLGAAAYVQDTGVAVGNGGMVMFGAGQGAFAAIKGYILNGGTNTTGDLIVSTRRANADATLTETARFKYDGGTVLAGALTGTTADFSGNVKLSNTLSVYGGAVNFGFIQHDNAHLYVRPQNAGSNMYLGAAGANYVALTAVGNFQPLTTNVSALGGPSLRWTGVYSVLGDFTGNVTFPTQPPGTNNTTGATTAFVTAALAGVSPSTIQNHLTGCTLSNSGAWGIVFGPGQFADSTNAAMVSFSGITKLLNATWLAGTGVGGRGPGVAAPTAGAWYHCFAAIIGGVSDAFFDTSVTGANAPPGTTYKRRVHSVVVESPSNANIYPFVQYGDDIRWANQIVVASTFPVSPSLLYVFTPPGVRTLWRGGLSSTAQAGNAVQYFFGDAGQNPASPTFNIGTGGVSGSSNGGGPIDCWTNLSSQVAYQHAGAGANITIHALGYTDTRGRFG